MDSDVSEMYESDTRRAKYLEDLEIAFNGMGYQTQRENYITLIVCYGIRKFHILLSRSDAVNMNTSMGGLYRVMCPNYTELTPEAMARKLLWEMERWN